MVISLSSDGHLLCSYMGTDPSFFSTPKVDAREADYEQVEAEMKRLQKFIREATRTQGQSNLKNKTFIHQNYFLPLLQVLQAIKRCSAKLVHGLKVPFSDPAPALILDILPKTDVEEDLIVKATVSSSMDSQSVSR